MAATAFPLTYLFFDVAAACGFPNDISMTPVCDMAPNMVMVMPLAVGTMPFAGEPFRERP
jgi:hypothetical protein